MPSARKLVEGVVGAVTAVAKHALWYVGYQFDGRTHDDELQERDTRSSTGEPDS